MGIAKFWVDSEGVFCENPRHMKRYERQLRIEQRSLSRKVKGSNSWKRQKGVIAKLYNKIKSVRRDFLHKESTKIAKENSVVYMEDLKISNMTKRAAPVRNKDGSYAHNHQSQKSGLNKAILDCGWGMFRDMLKYKTTVVLVDPKYTSQKCSECGHTHKDNRTAQANFECVECGHAENADFNSAKNIKAAGQLLQDRQREALARA